MDVWHLTADAPREPQRVTPGTPVHLRIGTWPIESGQEVVVEFFVTPCAGTASGGRGRAGWIENRVENSYWAATLGPFADGDRVDYRVIGSIRGQTVATERTSFSVRPAAHLALIWHHHQPLYRDLTAQARGAYRLPWVRLHALRDYFGMAYVVAQHPEIHLTVNFSPVLLWQLEDYVERGASDRTLMLTRKSTARLSGAEEREIVETFFDAHWHNQIYPHPRYRALFEQRVAGRAFSRQDLTDLRVWFTLAWFAEEFRAGTVTLPDGSRASVQPLVNKGRDFTERDIETMLTQQDAILRNVAPLHRRLQDSGQIEITASPYYHPIAPLLIDTDLATLDRPGTSLPPRFAHPEDAEAQIAAAVESYRERFGRPLRGMWPAEGAVSERLVPFLVRHGVRWIATDEGVLARSGRYGYDVADPNVLCQPYHALNPGREGGVSVVFRHRGLSDAIGFEFGADPDPVRAAERFVSSIKDLTQKLSGDRDRLVSVVLDGENPWGSYGADGRPFLRGLYQALAAAPDIKTVTVSEYIDGNRERCLPAHPGSEQTRVYNLFTGSWIDEPGSAPGVDLGTWIGEPEENEAWRLLAVVRATLDTVGKDRLSSPDAFRAVYAAEGSDWFWWFGTDHESDADEAFDDLFRGHLRAACRLAGVDAPADLDRHIVPHRVIWTFTAPVDEIQAGDRLIVRTNCPGALSWTIDEWATVAETALTAVGGVMAGPARFAVTLGPFSAGTRLRFRFRCEHAGCDGASPCCRGDEHAVDVRERV